MLEALRSEGRHVRRLGRSSTRPATITDQEVGDDLPCPWCRAATRESDTHCPTCGRRFG